jgi:hypothetical protein
MGVTGLVRRLALDRCLPGFLVAANTARGTNQPLDYPRLLRRRLLPLLALYPDLEMPDNVCALAFLAVMTSFAIACGILK